MFRLYALWGFTLWLIATIAFRLFGHWLLGSPVALLALFVAAVPLIYLCTAALYRWRSVNDADRIRCSVCIAVPGMLLDIFSLLFYRHVFPFIPVEGAVALAAWLMWAYGLILLFGFAPTAKKPLLPN